MSETIDTMKAVFPAALDKTTGAERIAFLDEACAGDAALVVPHKLRMALASWKG
jgi:hypothetical protein